MVCLWMLMLDLLIWPYAIQGVENGDAVNIAMISLFGEELREVVHRKILNVQQICVLIMTANALGLQQ